MAEGRTYVQIAFWIILFPGLFLALTVLAVNLLGDGLRDTLDPKLARRM
jgi:peptide/nickel transport system permease protein